MGRVSKTKWRTPTVACVGGRGGLCGPVSVRAYDPM